ncbi:hypothetical protein KDH_62290 [Dictyobacter sp. S3.2.2.5]|uniref:Uncharacterized protein n=1 Tax=Dictyobacter halimunensis TaxID=3026934 RepID=A0ABQ6G032_9CHLR|nr:hypothetical protein KDH_62290 [Dictyobacter sp. S3.2.2.5]
MPQQHNNTMEPTSNISSRRAHQHITRAIDPTTLVVREGHAPVATIAIQTRKHQDHASMVVQAMVLDPPVPGQHVPPAPAAIAHLIVAVTPVVHALR